MKFTFYLCLSLLAIVVPVKISHADDVSVLMVKPAKCVTLRKGQVCYRNISVSFKALEPSDYCIHLNNDETPLKCWIDTTRGRLTLDFKSDKSAEVKLYEKTGSLIATSAITVAWVQKSRSRRRSGWRLF